MCVLILGLLSAVINSQASANLAGSLSESSARGKLLLVIAPDEFHPVLREFIAHKQRLLPTELCSLENILGKSQGVDDPEKLKRFLYEQWRSRGLAYALLGGRRRCIAGAVYGSGPRHACSVRLRLLSERSLLQRPG